MDIDLSNEAIKTLISHVISHIEIFNNAQTHAHIGTRATHLELCAKSRIEMMKLMKEGSSPKEVLSVLTSAASEGMIDTDGGVMAYFTCGGIPSSAIAKLTGDLLNRFVAQWSLCPGLAEMETIISRWICDDIVRFENGSQSGGILLSGGSMSNFAALICARRYIFPQEEGCPFSRATIYVTDQTHHCAGKNAILSGIPSSALRIVKSLDLGMCPNELEKMIIQDRKDGFIPMMIIGTAGTTSTGSIDDLCSIARISRKYNIWFHVDGAYGGFFALTERGRRMLQPGLSMADSVTLDFHKSFYITRAVAALVVRDMSKLKYAFDLLTDRTRSCYLPNNDDDQEPTSFYDLGPELTRCCRGIYVWMPMALHGIPKFIELLDEKLDLAQLLEERLGKMDAIEIFPHRTLTVVTFRLKLGGNVAIQRMADIINSEGKTFVTTTMVRGRKVIRICVLHYKTHISNIDALTEGIYRALVKIKSELASAIEMENNIKIISLKEADDLGLREQVVEIVAKSFSGPEFPLTMCPGTDYGEDVAALWFRDQIYPQALALGLSIVAIDSSTGRAEGASLLIDAATPSAMKISEFEAHPKLRPFTPSIALLERLFAPIYSEKLPLGHTLEVAVGATKIGSRNCGVASLMGMKCEAIVQASGFKRICTITVNAFSEKIMSRDPAKKRIETIEYSKFVHTWTDTGISWMPFKDIPSPHKSASLWIKEF